MNWTNVSESDEWKKVVLNSYPLKCTEVDFQEKKLNLFGTNSYLSNAPYLSYGGDFSTELEVGKEFLENITKPILIKSKQKLKLLDKSKSILVEDYKTFVLDISEGHEKIWKDKVKSKTRNQVRKAEKTDFQIKFGREELLTDFYQVISTAWRDLGTPTHSKEFYRNIINCFSNEEEWGSCFLIIYVEDRPVSSACLIYNKEIIHHPYAATIKDFNKFSINNLLYWNIIKYATQKGLVFFDMGRSKVGQNTVKYKLSWGAVEVPLYYYYFNKKKHNNEEDGKLIKFLIEIWKKLPLPIANFLGPKLIYKVLK